MPKQNFAPMIRARKKLNELKKANSEEDIYGPNSSVTKTFRKKPNPIHQDEEKEEPN